MKLSGNQSAVNKSRALNSSAPVFFLISNKSSISLCQGSRYIAADPGLRPCWLKKRKDSLTILRYFNNPPAYPPELEILLSLLLIFDIDNPIPAASDENVEMSVKVSNNPFLESELL